MATIAAMTATPSATTRAMSWQPPILRLPRPLMVATRALECGAPGRGSRFVRPTSELPRARFGISHARSVSSRPSRPSALGARASGNPRGWLLFCEIGRNARPPRETWTANIGYASSEIKQSKPGAKNTSRVASSPGDGSKPRHRGGRHRSARFPCFLILRGNALPRTPPRPSTRARPFAPDAERLRLKNYSRLFAARRFSATEARAGALRARFVRADGYSNLQSPSSVGSPNIFFAAPMGLSRHSSGSSPYERRSFFTISQRSREVMTAPCGSSLCTSSVGGLAVRGEHVHGRGADALFSRTAAGT